MPLTSKQHIVVEADLNLSVAVEKLHALLNDLPEVRIVSLSTVPADVTVMGKTMQFFQVVAVAEEV